MVQSISLAYSVYIKPLNSQKRHQGKLKQMGGRLDLLAEKLHVLLSDMRQPTNAVQKRDHDHPPSLPDVLKLKLLRK